MQKESSNLSFLYPHQSFAAAVTATSPIPSITKHESHCIAYGFAVTFFSFLCFFYHGLLCQSADLLKSFDVTGIIGKGLLKSVLR